MAIERKPIYYNDRGCDYCISCLKCPFIVCYEYYTKSGYSWYEWLLLMAIIEGMKFLTRKEIRLALNLSDFEFRKVIRRGIERLNDLE
jgi:hypothetical protein